MSVLFISDLHLDSSRPGSTKECLEFLMGPAREAEHLYILGDLFEAWVCDDDDEAWLEPLINGIASLTTQGTSCSFMHGNRDFLIGNGFASATRTQLLDEYTVIDLYGQSVLLTHGDLLCTDDRRYMTLRAQLRSPEWQRDFLNKSLAERRDIARELRELSETEIAAKSVEIMDVNQDTVATTMRKFNVNTLLHGHTHRPGIHRFELNGNDATRIVLGDWYSHGSFILWDRDGPRSCDLSS